MLISANRASLGGVNQAKPVSSRLTIESTLCKINLFSTPLADMFLSNSSEKIFLSFPQLGHLQMNDCKTLRCYSAPRESSQGLSSLAQLACSALGAVVQNGRGSSLDVVSFSSVMIFTSSSQAATKSQQKAMVLVTAYSDLVKVSSSEDPIYRHRLLPTPTANPRPLRTATSLYYFNVKSKGIHLYRSIFRRHKLQEFTH